MTAARADIDALTKEVAQQRGLKLKKKLAREVVDRDELKRRLLALAGDRTTQDDLRAEGLALARWGLIPRDTDYVQLMIDLLSDEVAGYYDTKTKKLTIAKGVDGDAAWADFVLARAIAHGLQDQAFDLEKLMKLPATDGDALLARRALVEGDGIALMIELALARKNQPPPWSNVAVSADLARAMTLPAGAAADTAFDRAPLAIREGVLFPYRAGLAFVAALRRQEPWSAIDAAFKRPPRSTEQILHPDKYAADDKPIAVTLDAPAALPDFKLTHATVWGELGFALFLRSHGIPAEAAAQAAEGWGGDRVIVLARDGEARPQKAIGIAELAWDSEADAIEAHEAAVRALDIAINGATFEHRDDITKWLALDGTISFVARRGSLVRIAIGVPAGHGSAIATEPAQASK